MRIKEVIVVEGKHDSATLKQYFEVDTIETNGSALHQETLALISQIQQTRGVIVFTDPDYPGTRIRNLINQAVDGCKNAFLPKSKALGKHKVGIEHATKEDLWEALSNVVTFQTNSEGEITVDLLVTLGLSGSSDSAGRRKELCEQMFIAPCNAKTLAKRLTLMHISKEQLMQLLEE